VKTVIIGGGKGCRAILELAKSDILQETTLDVHCVMDINPEAPGFVFAKEHDIRTTTSMSEAMSLPDIELVIEITGQHDILNEIHKTLPPSAQLIDHTFTHLLWDLVNAQQNHENQLAERNELEQRLETEMRHIQSLFDSIPDLVIVLNNEKRIIRANGRFIEHFDVSSNEILNKKCSEVLKGSSLDVKCYEDDCPIDDVFKSGKSCSRILQTPPPNETYWEVTHTPINTTDGQITEIIETWHRITERVLLRREVEESEQRFRQFIDSANDMISIKDLDGRYVVVNANILNTFQKKEKEFLGKTAAEVLSKKMALLIKHHDTEVVNRNQPHTYEEVFEIDGKDRHYQSTRFPLPDYKGDLVGVCTISRDITVRKQLQDQIVQSAKLVAVGKLAAGVAHEINNPLTGILAFSEDMQGDIDQTDPHYEDLGIIIRETLRCRDIVRNLLDFARQDSPVLKDVNINDVMTQVLSLVEKLPRFKDINLTRNISENIPFVKADPRQLQQVVLNLILNAVDAMKEKGTIIITTIYNRRQDNCEISVEDTGPGIPENLIDKVFEPFFSTKGTNGLGLALSWGIIERHHGTIEVDTADSGGAIFRILLPSL